MTSAKGGDKEGKKWTIYRWLWIVFQLFFVGLLLQFFLHTLVTFEWWWDSSWMQLVWLWKEMLIVVLGLFLLARFRSQVWDLMKDGLFQWSMIAVLGLLLVSFVSTVVVNDGGVSQRIYSLKYNLFPLLVFLVFYAGVRLSFRSFAIVWWRGERISRFVAGILLSCLFLALLWYVVVSVKPGTLEYMGYDTLSYEGEVGAAPPAVYRNQYNQGVVRNQFVFERPIMWGFYLIAFWPLFFVVYLRRQPFSKRWFEWFLYVLNVFLTFSRAARGAWILETVLLLWLTYVYPWQRSLLWVKQKKRTKKQIEKKWWGRWCLSVVSMVVVFVWAVGMIQKSGILQREFSDKWHVEALVDGVQMFVQKPLLGHGGGSAGPASHQGDHRVEHDDISWNLNSLSPVWKSGFNPENQFLQIGIEYGLLWLVFRLLFYFGLLKKAYCSRRMTYDPWRKKGETLLLWSGVAVGVWLLWLAIEWLVLHSFGDRMSIYPLMAVAGMVLALIFCSPQRN